MVTSLWLISFIIQQILSRFTITQATPITPNKQYARLSRSPLGIGANTLLPALPSLCRQPVLCAFCQPVHGLEITNGRPPPSPPTCSAFMRVASLFYCIVLTAVLTRLHRLNVKNPTTHLQARQPGTASKSSRARAERSGSTPAKRKPARGGTWVSRVLRSMASPASCHPPSEPHPRTTS